MTESKTDPGVPGPPIPAPVDASALEQLIAKWRGREIASGQYSVDTGSQYAAGQAHALRDLADELEALLAAPRAPLEGEQSCQAATGDTAGDIGVIEPSVFDAESVAVPTDSPRAPLEPREEQEAYAYLGSGQVSFRPFARLAESGLLGFRACAATSRSFGRPPLPWPASPSLAQISYRPDHI
jgi:hypothetical protein